MKRMFFGVALAGLLGAGCGHQQPVMMAPPMVSGQGGGPVYDWTQVPVNQNVPVVRAVFDQQGYQIYDQAGDTIEVPFANQNMYVMKFGQSNNGQEYFINDGTAPTLYIPQGGYVENASAQGARWYPFPQNYAYSQPVYMGLAPTWADFTGMGWYPGMAYYGGYWGYRPWAPGLFYTPMVGLNFNIGGRPYYGWDTYHSYYRSNPANRVTLRPTYNYASVGRQSGSSFGRNTGRGSFSGRPSSSSCTPAPVLPDTRSTSSGEPPMMCAISSAYRSG